MLKKLVRHGNSRALVIDRPILDLLSFEGEDIEVEIRTDGVSLIITPVPAGTMERTAFERAAEETADRYAATFKRLAE
jgi:antitoxin component of MazEF toxin-antitoxin module